MPHRCEAVSESSVRAQLSASSSVLQNRAFIELSRILSSGDSAVLSSALPVIVRGAGVPSAVIFMAAQGELTFVAADAIPLKLRAYLEEPAFTGALDFLGRRALSQRKTLIDAAVFGASATAGALTAVDEAAWQCAVAVPILSGGLALGVILAGVRKAHADGPTVAFLEATANILGAVLGKPSPRVEAPQPPWACSGCLAHLGEALVGVGRALASHHSVVRDLCFRPGAPPEADALLGHSRMADRGFRRLADLLFHMPAAPCAHARRAASMATAVDAAVLAARPALASARAEVELVCAPSCEIEGDPELIAVAVRHLIINAAEAFTNGPERSSIPTGRRHIRICVRHEGPNAVVHVEDSGPGVAQDLRARVFEPSVSTKGPGRGLGLAVARHIVDAHGGWMELSTSELGGARVSVFVPAQPHALDRLRKATTQRQIPMPSGLRRAMRSAG